MANKTSVRERVMLPVSEQENKLLRDRVAATDDLEQEEDVIRKRIKDEPTPILDKTEEPPTPPPSSQPIDKDKTHDVLYPDAFAKQSYLRIDKLMQENPGIDFRAEKELVSDLQQSDKRDRDYFRDRLNRLNAQREALDTAAESKRNTLKWLAIANAVSQGLIKLYAISRADESKRFNPQNIESAQVNFDRFLDRIEKEYDRSRQELRAEKRDVEGYAERGRQERKRAGQELLGDVSRKLFEHKKLTKAEQAAMDKEQKELEKQTKVDKKAEDKYRKDLARTFTRDEVQGYFKVKQLIDKLDAEEVTNKEQEEIIVNLEKAGYSRKEAEEIYRQADAADYDLPGGNDEIDKSIISQALKQKEPGRVEELAINYDKSISELLEDYEKLSPKKSQARSEPEIGEIRGDYRFKGGDPGDRDNWELVE